MQWALVGDYRRLQWGRTTVLVRLLRRGALAEALLLLAVFMYLAGFVMYYDLSVFTNWVDAARELGVTRIYDAREVFGFEYRVVYPPLSPTMFIANYMIAQSVAERLASGATVSYSAVAEYLERLIVKLPMIAAALVLWKVFRARYGARAGLVLAMGPPMLIVLTVYNFDLLMVVSIFLSIALLASGRLRLSAAMLAVAALFKQIAVLAYIPLALWVARNRGLRVLAEYTGVYALVLGLAVLPFIVFGGFDTLLSSVLGFHGGRPPQGPSVVSGLYYLLWSMGVERSVLELVASMWAPLLVVMLLLLVLASRPRPEASSVEEAVAAVFTAYLAVGKVVNPVYTLWAYPFIVSAAFKHRDTVLLKRYVVYSLLVVLYFFLMYTSAYAVGGSVYLPEEDRWLSYSELLGHLYASFGPYSVLVDAFLYAIRLPILTDFFGLLYTYWWTAGFIVSLASTLMALLVLQRLARYLA